MTSQSFENTVTFCATISILLTTATSYIMNTNQDNAQIANILSSMFSEYYGSSIIFLILLYVLFYFTKDHIEAWHISTYTHIMVFNTFLSALFITCVMHPYLLLESTYLLAIVCLGANIAIPFMLCFFLFIELIARVLRHYNINF
jgi:hypothetical protein